MGARTRARRPGPGRQARWPARGYGMPWQPSRAGLRSWTLGNPNLKKGTQHERSDQRKEQGLMPRRKKIKIRGGSGATGRVSRNDTVEFIENLAKKPSQRGGRVYKPLDKYWPDI